jgi:hypothetical protein
MRKVILQEFVSLDGLAAGPIRVMQEPDLWTAPGQRDRERVEDQVVGR